MGFLGGKWFIHRCLPQSEEIKERQTKACFVWILSHPTIIKGILVVGCVNKTKRNTHFLYFFILWQITVVYLTMLR